MIGDFRWTRGSTSAVCAKAEANNCLLTVEEMGFGSDMKHLSGFDPKLHCCFCQKLGMILNLSKLLVIEKIRITQSIVSTAVTWMREAKGLRLGYQKFSGQTENILLLVMLTSRFKGIKTMQSYMGALPTPMKMSFSTNVSQR